MVERVVCRRTPLPPPGEPLRPRTAHSGKGCFGSPSSAAPRSGGSSALEGRLKAEGRKREASFRSETGIGREDSFRIETGIGRGFLKVETGIGKEASFRIETESVFLKDGDKNRKRGFL